MKNKSESNFKFPNFKYDWLNKTNKILGMKLDVKKQTLMRFEMSLKSGSTKIPKFSTNTFPLLIYLYFLKEGIKTKGH